MIEAGHRPRIRPATTRSELALVSFLRSFDWILIAAAAGAVGLIVVALIPLDLWRRYWKVVYGATLGLVFIVFVGAETIRGSKRWIDIGFIQFQPSELGKVLFVLALAGFVVGRVGPTTRWRTI